MSQQPVKAESIQIDPAMSGSRLINSNADESLQFVDPFVTAKLLDLAGLNLTGGVYTVGKSGYGAKYGTVSDAIADIPVTSTVYDPAVIMVFPGLYEEDVVIEKSGISIVGVGPVTIRSLTATHSIVVQSSVVSTPEYLQLKGLRIENSNNGKACIHILGASGSTVGLNEIVVDDCDLIASGVGSYQILADTSNHIRVRGGNLSGSSSSLVKIVQCHEFSMSGVGEIRSLQFEYDTTDPVPNQSGSSYRVNDSVIDGNILSNLSGAGTLTLSGISSVNQSKGDITAVGDTSVTVVSCRIRDITMTGPSVVVSNSYRRNVTGTGTYSEDVVEGSISFLASSSEAYLFPIEGPDDQFIVVCDCDVDFPVKITNKLSTGFTAGFAAPQTGTVSFRAMRRI